MLGIINQGETLAGNSPLNGPTSTLPDLYNLPASDFNKLTQLATSLVNSSTPTSGGISAGNATYNQSGLGSPVANRLAAGLVGGHDTISGQVVNSGNSTGLAGWTVYLSNSAKSTGPTAGEATTTTDANGYFHFLVAPGTYYVHVVTAPDWQASKGNVSTATTFNPGGDDAQTTAAFQFQQASTISLSQPASAAIDSGQSDTLSVTPSGGVGPYSYQWYTGTSGTTTNPISGATSSTYTASPTSTTKYWVQVTDLLNFTANSKTATITVNTALTITNQPAGANIDNGQSDTLSVTPSGGTTPLSYQWYIGATPISGATSSTYTASPTSTTSYSVKITDSANGSAGPSTSNSNTATITVNPALTITSQPANANIDNGQSDTLSVATSGGTAPLSYQWYIGATPISGATSSTYTASPTSTTSYSVKITDSANGSAGPSTSNSKTATITVNPAITLSPTSLPTAAVGLPYNAQLSAGGGSGTGFSFKSTSNLDGLILSSTGLLSGKPSTIGSFSIAVTATDSIGGTGSQAYTLNVMAPQQTVGIYNPAAGQFNLSNILGNPGAGNINFTFSPSGAPSWVPIAGNFGGTGLDTVGLYDPNNAVFHLATAAGGTATINFQWTADQVGADWIPVAGNFFGSTTDTVGLYDPHNEVFHLSTVLANPTPAQEDSFAVANAGTGWVPIAGAFAGGGLAATGLYDPNNAIFHISTTLGGAFTSNFQFGNPTGGIAANAWKPFAGVFNNNGTASVGLYDPNNTIFHVSTVLATPVGSQETSFQYGGQGWVPIAGDWDFPTLPQLAAGGEARIASGAVPLTNGQLQTEVQAALNLLASDGVNKSLLAQLGSLQFTVGQLPAGYLGLSNLATGQVEISADAAGYGWFVDANPLLDQAFINGVAQPGGAAANRIDLLTVVLHEMGHFDGWTELDPLTHPDVLMALTLATGQRRIQDIDAVFAVGPVYSNSAW